MRLLKLSLVEAKLKINSEYNDTNVKMNVLQVFCLAFVNFVSIGRTKGNKRIKYPFIAFSFFFFHRCVVKQSF